MSKATVWGSAANRSLVSQETFPTTTWLVNAFNSVTCKMKDKMFDEAEEDSADVCGCFCNKMDYCRLQSDELHIWKIMCVSTEKTLLMWGTNLDWEVFIDKWQKHNVLVVPHLLSIDLDFAPKFPTLPTVPYQNLNKHIDIMQTPPLNGSQKVWMLYVSQGPSETKRNKNNQYSNLL